LANREIFRVKKVLTLLITFMCLSCAVQAETIRYEKIPVIGRNLVGNLYLPKLDGKLPVVIAFGGSEGGLHMGDSNGEMLAPHGVAVLALAYFKAEGVPPTLDQIPLEYFFDAIGYLATVPEIDLSRLGVVSGSRGSEAALLLASMDARIKSVVVTTPSKVAWFGRTKPRSAWTYGGIDIPALSLELDEKAPVLSRFDAALGNAAKVKQAQIPLEKINGPILLVSAENDEFWPSYQMSKDMVDYLNAHHFRYAVTHNSYKTGHGFSKETAPEIKQSIIDHFLRTLRQ
jgi:dienelactone hydrolase